MGSLWEAVALPLEPSRGSLPDPNPAVIGRGESAPARRADRITMLDVVFIAGGLAFFAASAGYAALCERL